MPGRMVKLLDVNFGNVGLRQMRSIPANVVTTLTSSLHAPTGIVVDATGTYAYVCDYTNHQILKITLATGASAVFSGTGAAGGLDGAYNVATYNHPYDICLNPAGTYLYCADKDGDIIRRITVADGTVLTIAGSYGIAGTTDHATGTSARFTNPTGICIDPSGTYLYVTDYGAHTIRRVATASTYGVTTIAGTAGATGSADGVGTLASFNQPHHICIDATGVYLYVADRTNYKIRRINVSSLVVKTLLGGSAGNLDGYGLSAMFSTTLGGLVIDTAGEYLYLADVGNVIVRRVELATLHVTIVAGSGTASDVDGTGTAASFNSPSVVALSHDGTYLLVTTSTKIRKIT